MTLVSVPDNQNQERDETTYVGGVAGISLLEGAGDRGGGRTRGAGAAGDLNLGYVAASRQRFAFHGAR